MLCCGEDTPWYESITELAPALHSAALAGRHAVSSHPRAGAKSAHGFRVGAISLEGKSPLRAVRCKDLLGSDSGDVGAVNCWRLGK